MLAFFRNEMGFGGNNGLTDFKDILGYPLASEATRVSLMLGLRRVSSCEPCLVPKTPLNQIRPGTRCGS